MYLFKISLLVVLLSFNLYSKENKIDTFTSLNQVYFLPDEADETKDNIFNLIKNAKKSISIGMYNFSYKKLAKQLVASSKNGVNIKIILDKSKVSKDDKIYKYFKKNGITVKIADKKLHTKLAVFDEKIAVMGSINWTKESFKDNYEIVLFTKDKKTINKMLNFINNF
ncbi:MAG: nuclease [Arcobacter sp.]|nr:nuclease [Arcobacter sp.]|tara:strand:- start:2103 stop:2606 length:504 start_codon:yes stop_codon:yes gene_type:complete